VALTRDISVAILAGGLGARARSISQDTPKVLLEVGGRPFLHYLLRFVQKAAVRHVVLCTGYRAEMVERALGTRFGGIELEYSREPAALGTAGALRLACDRFRCSHVLVLNGDSCCGCNLETLLAEATNQPHGGTIGVVHVADCGRYGRVEFDAGSRITSFVEKGAAAGPGWINAGIYVLPVAWVCELPAGQPCSLERDAIPRWIARGLFAHRCPGPFVDIGTPQSYAQAEHVLAALETVA
jgi:NDP-sugar pyrophosphorylase family protein